jgi:hypothetical protein
VLALEVALRAGESLSLQEEGGHRAALEALELVAVQAMLRLDAQPRARVRARRMKQIPLFPEPRAPQERLSDDEGPPTARSAVRVARRRRRAA